MSDMQPKQRYALLSEASYRYPFRISIDGYTLVDKYSDTSSSLFKNEDNDYVLAVRGTKLTDLDNIVSDVLLFFDQLRVSEDYKKAEVKLKAIKREVEYGSLTLTGHSLGAAIALSLFEKYSKKVSSVWGYSLPKSFNDTFRTLAHQTFCKLPLTRKLSTCKRNKRIHLYTSGTDVISLLSRLDDNNSHQTTNLADNSHTIANFTKTTKPILRKEKNPNAIYKNTDNNNLRSSSTQMPNLKLSKQEDKMFNAVGDPPKVLKGGSGGGKRKANVWAMHVQKEYRNMKAKNPDVKFKDVLRDPGVKRRYQQRTK